MTPNPPPESSTDRSASALRIARHSSGPLWPLGSRETGCTLTIAAAPETVFKFFSNPQHLRRLGADHLLIEPQPDGGLLCLMTWKDETFRFPAGIAERRDGELLRWKTSDDAPSAAELALRFQPAPAGRGTEVDADLTWTAPMGAFEAALARLRGAHPRPVMMRLLRRARMFIETGEIAVSGPGEDS